MSALVLILFPSCYKPHEESGQEHRFSISPKVEGIYLTKAGIPDVPALMEDDISGGFNVYISGHGTFLKYRIGSAADGGVYFLSSSWKEDGIVVGQEYDVYAVANGDYDHGSVASISDLEALVAGPDNDIYRLYDPTAGTYDLAKTRNKKFLMDGHVSWTPTNAPEQTIDITLERAAAKIQVDFSLAPQMSGYTIYGSPEWKFMNYSTVTSVLDDESPAPENLISTPILMNVSSYSASGGSITTYSYPHSWTETEKAAFIIINIPLIDQSGNIIDRNYYSIPLVNPEDGVSGALERNTFYRVTASLESVGSSGEDATDRKVALEYEVLPWVYDSGADEIHVTGQELEYLLVDPLTDEIRENVLAGNYVQRTRQLNFWASGRIACTEAEVYYYDKNGNRIDASSTSPVSVSVSGVKSGTVDVRSTALHNNTVKYIRFRVYLVDNDSVYEDILIRHYPLDYILNIEGLWSSLITSGWVDWELDQTPHTPRKTVANEFFEAKVYSDSKVKQIKENRVGDQYQAVVGNGYPNNLYNNRMYVVQITSTSESYSVGRVSLDSNFQSQDHFVSPAFMIASQLGATYRTNSGSVAALHCGNYKEVATDGRVFTGWRLPTREEIGIIMGYQYASDAIDEVLAGPHYWTLEGKAVSKTQFSNPSADGTTGHIRCLRDLSVEELEIINSQE